MIRWPDILPGGKARHWLKRLALCACLPLAGIVTLESWFAWYGASHPLDLSRLDDRGRLYLDRDGGMLHMTPASDGIFRLTASVDQVDERFLQALVAYEDKRFWHHGGVDYLALARAGWQAAVSGEIVSGASTLTMQVARLLEPRPRTFGSKMVEMARARQLEKHFSKQEILGFYLTLAPYGGPVEGIRAASWTLLGREPDDLNWGEAALLTVLPQSPSRYRPDRHPKRAGAARDKVLRRIAPILDLDKAEIDAHGGNRIRLAKRQDNALVRQASLHPAFRLATTGAASDTVQTSLDRHFQGAAAEVIKAAASKLDPGMSAAAIIADSWTGKTVAYIGSPDYLDESRAGAVNMAAAVRSPGSALKPFIYATAMDDGFAHPLTMVVDNKTSFGSYAPGNFRDRFHGEVTVMYALKHSLNVPAVKLLDRIGPARFKSNVENSGVRLHLPGDEAAGLPLALGGVGITLEDLVRLYTAVAQDGRVRPLDLLAGNEPEKGTLLIGDISRRYLVEMLKGVSPPDDLMPAAWRRGGRKIAFKTGTSWGFRDALAIGFDSRWVVGVWTGRPDGAPSPGHYGARTAAPILFDLFNLLPESVERPAPDHTLPALVWDRASLGPGQRHLDRPPVLLADAQSEQPVIHFPQDGSTVMIDREFPSVLVDVSGGSGELSLLVNGKPATTVPRSGQVWWHPDGDGFHELRVVDQDGQVAGIRLRATMPPPPETSTQPVTN